MIGAEMDEGTIFAAKVLINTGSQQPFIGQVVDIGLKHVGARAAAGKSDRAIAATGGQAVSCAVCAGSIVVDAENLIVERNLGRISRGRKIGEGGGLKLWTWDVYRRRGRDEQTQAFRIHEEESLVLDNGASEGSGPLVGVIEGAGSTGVVVKPVVG